MLLVVEVLDFLIGHIVEEGAVKEHTRVDKETPRCFVPESIMHRAGKVLGHALAAPLERMDAQVLLPGGFTGDAGGTGMHQLSGEVLTLDGDAVILLQSFISVASAGVSVGVVLLLV